MYNVLTNVAVFWFVSLTEIYQRIAQADIKHVERLAPGTKVEFSSPATGDSVIKVDTVPVGNERTPAAPSEAYQCMIDIISALSSLHAAGVAWVDIRYSNIVDAGPNLGWYLIDAEHAVIVADASDPRLAADVVICRNLFANEINQISTLSNQSVLHQGLNYLGVAQKHPNVRQFREQRTAMFNSATTIQQLLQAIQ